MSGQGAHRRAWAQIDLGALRHNLARVRAYAPNARVIAALKADAYGHGALQAAQALQEADGFAVASIAEALQLRWAGILDKPIVVLSSPLEAADLTVCADHGLEPLFFDNSQLPLLSGYSGKPLRIWFKLDTGMHRLGLELEQVPALYQRIQASPSLELAGWMTHLACADDVGDPSTRVQVERFNHALGELPGERSIANSAGIVAWPETHVDAVRPGIMLYGASPLLDRSPEALGLRPVMTLRAPLISLREVAAGEAIGYGATWRTKVDTRIGVVAIGYGDGYPRHLPNGTPVLVGGRQAPLVGRVSMDMITVDLGEISDVAVGESAILWGPGLPADEIARAAGTIAYELFCQLTSRVTFEYMEP